MPGDITICPDDRHCVFARPGSVSSKRGREDEYVAGFRLVRQGGARGEAVEEYGLVTESREIPVSQVGWEVVLQVAGTCLNQNKPKPSRV